jgi:hypothetical protein
LPIVLRLAESRHSRHADAVLSDPEKLGVAPASRGRAEIGGKRAHTVRDLAALPARRTVAGRAFGAEDLGTLPYVLITEPLGGADGSGAGRHRPLFRGIEDKRAQGGVRLDRCHVVGAAIDHCRQDESGRNESRKKTGKETHYRTG